MKKLLVLLVVLCLLTACSLPGEEAVDPESESPVSPPPEVVGPTDNKDFEAEFDIPDPGLFYYLCENFSGDDCFLSKEEAQSITKIFIEDPTLNISDISGLEHFINLTSLTINNQHLSPIGCISALVQLEHLSLSGNHISYLANEGYDKLSEEQALIQYIQWEKLENLQSLDLSLNWLADISPLATIPSLRSLSLSGNLIRDVSPLADAAHLENINLTSNYARFSQYPLLQTIKNSGVDLAVGMQIEWDEMRGIEPPKDVFEFWFFDDASEIVIDGELAAPGTLYTIPADIEEVSIEYSGSYGMAYVENIGIFQAYARNHIQCPGCVRGYIQWQEK